jgi:hypothetical protein
MRDQDAYSNRIAGYCMDAPMPAALAVSALRTQRPALPSR